MENTNLAMDNAIAIILFHRDKFCLSESSFVSFIEHVNSNRDSHVILKLLFFIFTEVLFPAQGALEGKLIKMGIRYGDTPFNFERFVFVLSCKGTHNF